MGKLVTMAQDTTSRAEQTDYGDQSRDQQTIYMEFERARVKSIVHNSYRKDTVNQIEASISLDDSTALSEDTVTAIPLLRGLVDQPQEGDTVLLCNFDNVDYYIGPLNSYNNPQFNPSTSNDPSPVDKSVELVEDNTNAGYRWDVPFTNLGHSGKLSNQLLDYPAGSIYENTQSQLGDMILEGRMGNSIRLGSRATGPYTIISNGNSSIYENFFNTNGMIALTDVGKLEDHIGLVSDETQESLKFSIDVDDNDKRTDINYDYIEPQIYIGSNRIIFNTTSDNILMSSSTTVDINSLQNINLSTPKDVVIDSQDIYLGKEAQDNGQPVVLGIELFEILSELLALLSTIGTSAPAPQPVMVLAPAPVNPAPGSTEPPTPTIAGPLGPKVANIQNRLSKILSGNIFVKNNEG